MIKKYDWIRIIQFSSILSRELEYIKQHTFNLKLVCEKREFYFIFFCQSFVKIQSKLIYFNLWFISHICILFSPQITCSIFLNTIRFFPMPPLLSTKMFSQKRKSWKVCYKLTEKNIKLPCTVCGDFYLFFCWGTALGPWLLFAHHCQVLCLNLAVVVINCQFQRKYICRIIFQHLVRYVWRKINVTNVCHSFDE